MVDVRKVMVPDRAGVISLEERVAFAPMWFAVHRRMDNLLLKRDFSEILDGSKFSWRLMAEMLLEMEDDGLPQWARIEWVVFELKTHEISKVENPVGGIPLKFQVGENAIVVPKYWYGWTKDGNPGKYNGLTANVEHQYNNQMMKLFGKKFPFRLKSMSPFSGPVTVSVPVDKPKDGVGSAYAKLLKTLDN